MLQFTRFFGVNFSNLENVLVQKIDKYHAWLRRGSI